MQHQRMLERVLEVSARLAEASDVDAVLQAVCDGIQDALGFDKVLIGIADEPGPAARDEGRLGLGARTSPALDHGASLEALEGLFSEDFEVAGCYLLPAEVAEDRLGIDDFPYRSELNGRGPHAWSRHWLLVPLVDGDRRIGVIWVDDPRDRLLPTRARLQALRLFANQAVAALHTAKQAVAAAPRGDARRAHRAARTGAPSATRVDARDRGWRRASRCVLCDMDNLKTVNDTHGHDAGDKALQSLAGRAAQPAAPQRRGLPDRRRRVRGGAARGQPARRRARDEAAARRGSRAASRRAAARSRPASASRCTSPVTIPSAWSRARTRRSTRSSAGARNRSPDAAV